jgi:Fe-Mn family superoxide dismutase
MKHYTLPELPYDPAALEPWYSGEIVALHHDKHHKAYVDGANKTVDQLEEARDSDQFDMINQLEKNLAFNLSGHILHSVFWENMTPDAGTRPEGELLAAIEEHFKSFEAMRAQLTAATNSVQGVGWGALAWDPMGQRLMVEQIYDHQGNIGQAATPLLVIDGWEHAYYLQYKNVRADWVEAFWNIVNWQDVTARFTRARAAQLVVA